ncbi:hypothetical protein D3C75_1191340 [compost metagenome]
MPKDNFAESRFRQAQSFDQPGGKAELGGIGNFLVSIKWDCLLTIGNILLVKINGHNIIARHHIACLRETRQIDVTSIFRI